jgi:5-enolpyruvylshikimate-3-phosphate synthase
VRRIGFALALASTLALAVAPAALAKQSKSSPPGVQQVINDCMTNGKLTHRYPEKLLAQALAEMQTSTLQYSDCEDVVAAAEQAELAGSKNKAEQNQLSGGNARTPAPKADKHKLQQAAHGGKAPIVIAGQTITPGAVVLQGNTLLGSLPTPLLIALLALLGTAVVLAGERVRRHVRARSTH